MRSSLLIISLILLYACGNKADSDKLNFLKKGNLAFEEGNSKEALRFYDEALMIDSTFVDAWNNRGLAEMNLALFDEAIYSFNQAIRYKPEYATAYLNYVKANLAVKQYYAALEGIDQLEKYWADSSINHFTRGLVYHDMGNDEEAMKSFQRTWSLDSTNSETLVNMANIYYHNTNYVSAIDLVKEALAMNANNPSAYNILAMCYVGIDALPEALQAINTAYTLDKNDAYILNNLGYINYQIGKYTEAEEHLISSMKMDPYNAWLYRNLGLLRWQQGELGEAERYLSKAFQMEPELDNLLNDYIEILKTNGNTAKICDQLSEDEENAKYREVLKQYCQ